MKRTYTVKAFYTEKDINPVWEANGVKKPKNWTLSEWAEKMHVGSIHAVRIIKETKPCEQ